MAADHYAESLADADQSLTLAPCDPWALALKGWLLTHTDDRNSRDVPRGLTHIRRALDLTQRRSPQILERLSQAEETAGELDRAIATQQELLTLIDDFYVDDSVITQYQARLARLHLQRVAFIPQQ